MQSVAYLQLRVGVVMGGDSKLKGREFETRSILERYFSNLSLRKEEQKRSSGYLNLKKSDTYVAAEKLGPKRQCDLIWRNYATLT